MSDCEQLPASVISFTGIELETTGSTDYSTDIPWTEGFETTDDITQEASPLCGASYGTSTHRGRPVVDVYFEG